MNVFLVPVGGRRYQLYVEVSSEEPPTAGEAETSFGARQVQRFRSMLTEAERERLRRERGEPSEGGGLWRAVMRKIAETVAEQRLLWHLRQQTAVRLVHPDDLSGSAAVAEATRHCAEDFQKHRRWLAIHLVVAVVTGVVFFLVPGPNLIAYYFVFRAVGHYFAMRGARQGASAVEWRAEASPLLTAVREALQLPAAERSARLTEIADALHLQHLAGFVTRVAVGKS